MSTAPSFRIYFLLLLLAFITPSFHVSEPVLPPLTLQQSQPGYEYNEKTNAYYKQCCQIGPGNTDYKLHTKKSRGWNFLHPLRAAVQTCFEEGAELLKITSDEDLKQVQAMKNKYLDLEARIMVASGVHNRPAIKMYVVDRNGKIDTEFSQDRPFVCKVAANDVPVNKAECSNDYESRISTTGSCYKVSTEVATWDEAQAICQAEGAHLLILNSAEELEVVYNMLKDKPHEIFEEYFVGVKADTSTEPRVFKTVLNQTLEEVGYGPWEEGEPDNFENYIGGENCVTLDIRLNGKYRDVHCFVYRPYVCEISGAALENPVPSSTPSNDIKQGSNSVSSSPITFKKYRSDYEYNINTDAFYKLHTEGASKMYASEVCKDEGAELVKLTSDDDSKQVLAMMEKLPDLGDYVMVETDENRVRDRKRSNHFRCNVMNREGKIVIKSIYKELPFVCKVAAQDAPYNEECGVYSNDYESRISTTGSCYKVSTAGATWSEALASCQADGAQLVVLSSDEELEVLYNMLQDKPHHSETQYFAGVWADTTSEPRVFKTVSNQTLEEVGYGPWDEDEPNDYEGDDNCVALDTRRHGKYNDVWCNLPMQYVCESAVGAPLEISEPPTPSSNVPEVTDPVLPPLPLKQSRPGYEYNEKTNAYYKLHTKSRGWNFLHPLRAAVQTCNEEGAELLKITSDEDLKQVQAMKKKYLDLEARVMVASGVHNRPAIKMYGKCNVVDRNGKIDTEFNCQDRPFVCAVAAKDVPVNKAECSNGYESRISTTGSCYRVSTEVATWDEAEAICQAEGAHLVILNSAEELEVVYNMLKDKPHEIFEEYFVGVKADTSTEPRVFKTVLNQTLEEVGYGPWEEGEPDNFENYIGGENCVTLDIRLNGKYRDVHCFVYRPYVCEISGAALGNPVPSSTPSNDIKQGSNSVSSSPITFKKYRSDYEYNINTDAFYKLHTEGALKMYASEVCKDEGAELVKLTSDDDSKQVHAMMEKLPDLEDYVMVETDENRVYGRRTHFKCNVMNREGKIEITSIYKELPFVCKVAAQDAPYNEECGVYSNDYESRVSTTGSCYRVSTPAATWSEALASCQADGAQLVVLSSDKELEVLINLLQDKPHNSETQYFAGVWADTTSEPRVFKTVLNQTLEEVGYGPWDEDEPNDYVGGENCVVLDTRRHGKYNDVRCDVLMPYVCEIAVGAPLEISEPSSTPSSDVTGGSNSVSSRPIKFKKYRSDYEYNMNTDAFYKLHTEGATKTTASIICRKEGAELVKLTSDNDSKHVLAMMEKLPDLEDYVMVEIDVNSVYGSRNHHKCNVMNRRGKTETTSIHQKLPFVCKVAAQDAPYNKECGVYSNDYESRISTTGSCYRVSTAAATWNEALASCQADGAQLVVLSSDEELEVLYNMLQDKPHDSETQYFAGVRSAWTSEPRAFRTVLNETLEEVGYGPWEESEPNNYEGGENCVALDTRRHGKYNDVWCNVRMPYVCESAVGVPPEISEPSSTPSMPEPVSSPLPYKQYRQDYQYNDKTDAFYKLHTDGVSKRLASKKCIEEGAELAEITSDEDLRQIQAMMKEVPNLKDSVMVASEVYKGHGSQSDEKCNVVNSEGEIRTTNPYDDRPFVCKVAARDAPINVECRVFSNGYESMISTTGSCYRVSTDVEDSWKSWNEAYASCQAEGAHLVILDNAEELEVLYKMLQEKPHDSDTQYYAGVREITFDEPRVFRTVMNQTLEEVGYEAWEENEPNDYEGGENCVALDTRRHGKYNDVTCFNRMPYVCESSVSQLQTQSSSGNINVSIIKNGLSYGANAFPSVYSFFAPYFGP